MVRARRFLLRLVNRSVVRKTERDLKTAQCQAAMLERHKHFNKPFENDLTYFE